LAAAPQLGALLALSGALFLGAYGLRALSRAWRPAVLVAENARGTITRRAAVAQAAAFTLLNPHVYLDTVMLVGAVGAQQTPALRPAFLIGACAASGLWFTAIGYGARWLAPWFARPSAWRVLDTLIGLTMLLLAALLARHVLA
jgi:L-lysine exporter family protein LysE/ArgO